MTNKTWTGFDFTDAALENIAETDADPQADLVSIISGEQDIEDLLDHCLDGADPDRAQGWRDYCEAISTREANIYARQPRILLDNGGGVTLQIGSYAHVYESPQQAATDLAAWLRGDEPSGWEGNDAAALAVDPNAEELRNNGYRIITLDRERDTAASLAGELRSEGGAAARDMAAAL